MEESSNNLRKTLTNDSLNLNHKSDRRRESTTDSDENECDRGCWETLSGGIEQVQLVLDQNRALIQQVNENHQSKIPDNLVKNVALIREINGNVTKVLSLYSDLSVSFTDLVGRRKASPMKNSDGSVRVSGGNDVLVDANGMQ